MQRRQEELGFCSNTQGQSSLSDCGLSECYSVTSLWENGKRCRYICALVWEVPCHCNGETIPCSHLWSAALFAWQPRLRCVTWLICLLLLSTVSCSFSLQTDDSCLLLGQRSLWDFTPSLSLPQNLFTFALLFYLSLPRPLSFLFYYTQKVCFKIRVCMACI